MMIANKVRQTSQSLIILLELSELISEMHSVNNDR